jgi:serine/threonine protein kinase
MTGVRSSTGENERRPYLVLEYFPGVSLDVYRQQNGVIPPGDMVPLARAVAEAVHAAHQAGVFHHDLKPANVLVRRTDAGWDVRVIDFGLAVRHSAAVQASVAALPEDRTQRERSFAGTLRYAAPEQKGELNGVKVGPHSDVYSFGKTCLELLFGHTEAQAEGRSATS